MEAVMIMAVLVPMLMAAAFLLGRHLNRRQAVAQALSPVTRQHIDLFQGGQLNEALVEAAKARFRDLLERGDLAQVEASLRPGMHFVVQVRALAEIGTDDAGRILERQLQRRLSDDQLEQAWYWIDLASSLRSLNRQESLPHLLRLADRAGDIPLGHFFAAETVCFLGFPGYLREPEGPMARAALRVLHRAIEGLRHGVPPYMVMEARLGEMIEQLWDHRPETVHPLVVRVLAETLRLLRRAPYARQALAEEAADQEAFEWQMSRIAVLEPVLTDYLDEAPRHLCELLPTLKGPELRDALQALNDLHAEAGAALLPLLPKLPQALHESAVDVLTWSHDPRVGPYLRDWVKRRVGMTRRAQWRRRPLAPVWTSVASDVPYRAILRALRGHASAETEAFLALASCDWDPTIRAAAVGSLGWWEPLRRGEVLACLQQARRDPNAEVRQCGRAALARLGERQALQWFRQALTGEESRQVHEAIQVVAVEGLTLLWPDLDRLADSEDGDVAHLACEAIERLREDMDRRRG
jgi:hypothetical protein